MTRPSFRGLRVLVLESRRSKELAALVSTYGGTPVVAPALREVPLESNAEALAFGQALIRGEFDLVVLLTGVGTRALLAVMDHAGSRAEFVGALARTRIAARGPKPVAVLRELRIDPWVVAPEPNTWQELVAALDTRSGDRGLQGLRLAVQEYGASNPDLLRALEARGAAVTPVPVYRWALPDDLTQLRGAVEMLGRGEIDVVLFTTATQAVHLLQVATSMHATEPVSRALGGAVVASIGPTTSEELRRHGLTVDLEASHPKMGVLAREAAEHSRDLLKSKPATSPPPRSSE